MSYQSASVSLTKDTWTQLDLRSGGFVFHKSSTASTVKVLYAMADSTPTTGYSIIESTSQGDYKTFEGINGSTLWALAINGDATLNITDTLSASSALNAWNGELNPRTDVTTATQYEIHNALGLAFFFQETYTIAASASIYIGVQMPTTANGRIAAFHRSYIQAINGAVSIAVNQTATAIGTDAPITAYPDNRNNIKTNYTLPYESSTTPTGGAWILPDYVNQSGTGVNRIGSTLKGDQFRVYPADSFAALRITNQVAEDNQVYVGYSWIEPEV